MAVSERIGTPALFFLAVRGAKMQWFAAEASGVWDHALPLVWVPWGDCTQEYEVGSQGAEVVGDYLSWSRARAKMHGYA
jgi:hypothetical protein